MGYGSHQGNIDDATLLNSSDLINSGNTNIQAGNDIGVIASEVSSGREVNLNAVNNVLVAAGKVLRQSQEWNENLLPSGGNLFEMEKSGRVSRALQPTRVWFSQVGIS